ncbi:uncharacterized protein LOC9648289 [Selaginella moellendorffii]|uniref:uncharacterized protein LOC9648289 n=1 Tax=Selaginella moellendorffii TaxID=88036 RepID=UPI000D1C2326|nr:uncharacterized protein LOC9648289 [Selaginella moellendorffii]|eukprot:XP_024542546.1 uncharacterized protein LOC9648289 [Selaginella moellendorffii]
MLCFGLRFPTPPASVPDENLLNDARKQGNPVLLGLLEDGDKPVLISFSNRHVDTLLRLVKAADFEGMEKRLSRIKKEVDEILRLVTDEASRVAVKAMQLDIGLGLIDTSPMLLVFDCMRIFSDRLTRIYRKTCEKELSSAIRASFDKPLRKACEGRTLHAKKADLTCSATFTMFAAGLSEAMQEPVENGLSEEAVKSLANFYRGVIERYVVESKGELDEEAEDLFKALAPESKPELELVLKEWATFYSQRDKRNKAAHPATFIEGPQEDTQTEYARLVYMKEALEILSRGNNLDVVGKCAVVHYRNYVEHHGAASAGGAGESKE